MNKNVYDNKKFTSTSFAHSINDIRASMYDVQRIEKEGEAYNRNKAFQTFKMNNNHRGGGKKR